MWSSTLLSAWRCWLNRDFLTQTFYPDDEPWHGSFGKTVICSGFRNRPAASELRLEDVAKPDWEYKNSRNNILSFMFNWLLILLGVRVLTNTRYQPLTTPQHWSYSIVSSEVQSVNTTPRVPVIFIMLYFVFNWGWGNGELKITPQQIRNIGVRGNWIVNPTGHCR